MTSHELVLILGAPRSGTTWVTEVAEAALGTRAAVEPDNEKTSLLGVTFKRHVPRFPWRMTPKLHRLWTIVSSGRSAAALTRSHLTRGTLGLMPNRLEEWVARKEARVVGAQAGRPHELPPNEPPRISRGLAKSVHSLLLASDVATASGARRVVVTSRSPYAVLDSMIRLEMPDRFRSSAVYGGLGDDPVDDFRVQFGSGHEDVLVVASLHAATRAVLRDHPDWIEFAHEEACQDPESYFESLFTALDVSDTQEGMLAVRARNRDGTGYATARRADKEVDKWRLTLPRRKENALAWVLDRVM